MDDLVDIGSSLPVYALLPILAMAAVLVGVLVRRTQSMAARFVVVAIELRIALTASHEVTFASSPIGLSYNALCTIAISFIGLLIVRRRSFIGGGIGPFLPFLIALVVGGVMTAHGTSMANTFTKFSYLIVLILAVEDAIEDVGFDRFLRMMLPVFALPFVLQAASVVLNVAKASESDGSASYIGGFHHEAAFSVTLAAALLVVCLMRHVRFSAKLLLVILCVAGVVLANYRTVVAAMLPLVGFAVLVDAPRHFVAGQRAIIGGIMALLVASAGVTGAILLEDRFADIAAFVQQGPGLVKRPELLSPAEGKLMSGRVAIWNGYIYGWVDGTPEQRMLGHGPGSWYGHFNVYAHNTLISALYELGVIGVIAVLIMWGWMLALALLSHGGPKVEIVMAHICFFILNMATMPMWMIEGMIFYGLLCGVTLHFYHASRQPISRPRRMRPAFSRASLGA